MELYIEKDFLDNFYMDYQDGPIQEKVKTILSDYGSKTVFMDITVESQSDLEKLKSENPFFASLCGNDKVPVSVNSIEEHVFTKSNFEQTIIFMNEEQEWFKDAENKGAICFGFNGYKSGIKKIIDNLHFRIDLSEGFDGWDFLRKFNNINFNHITINDGYILNSVPRERITNNLIPILKNIISRSGIKIDLLTKEIINKNHHSDDPNRQEKIYKHVERTHRKLNSVLAHINFKFEVYLNNIIKKIDFHDRTISTNFTILECGRGFDLDRSIKSNSQIISESIFEKYTYNKLRRHQEMHSQLIKKHKGSNYSTLNFHMYPRSN